MHFVIGYYTFEVGYGYQQIAFFEFLSAIPAPTSQQQLNAQKKVVTSVKYLACIHLQEHNTL